MTVAAESPTATLELISPPDAPVIAVLGGISSSSHVCSTSVNPLPGWWEGFVGPECAIDSSKFCIAGMSYFDAPSCDAALSTRDQAAALLSALDSAGIDKLHAIIGASYGGMVALAFSEIAPHRVERLIVFGAAHESCALATAQRSLQRRVVELGIRTGTETDALVIARGMAITTYLTADELDRRFDIDDPTERAEEIERFLALGGTQFADSCAPDRFLSISRSLDLHQVTPEAITTPATIIGAIEDQLVPPTQLRELASRLGGDSDLHLISSPFGHDVFLEDHGVIAPIVEQAIRALP